MRFESLLEQYLNDDFLGRSAKTVANARQSLQPFVQFIGGRLTVQTYTAYVKAAHARWASTTARMHLGAAARFLAWCERMGHVKDSPHHIVRRPPPQARGPRAPFTVAEYEALKVAASGTVMEWPIVLAWETGMAIADCSLLQWSAVHLADAYLQVNRHKTGEACTIPLQVEQECYQRLVRTDQEPRSQDWPNLPGNGVFYVDPALAGRYLVQSKSGGTDLQNEFARVRARAGVDPDKSFHNFRATLLSTLANGGMQLAAACRVSGHRDPKIFLQYVTVDVEGLRAQMQRARASVPIVRQGGP